VLARVETHLTIRRLQLELQQKNQSLQTANETLEERVQARTAELAQANDSLKAEIERRKRHQQEKDRLFKVVSQQSEQLRTMTTWLIQAGQTERQGLASDLRAEIAQKVEVLQADLAAADQMLKVGNTQTAAEHLTSITQILAQVERYVTQVTTDLPQPTAQEQDLSENPLIKLTSREREILQMLAQGKSSGEIAAILDITASSVHTYNHRIKNKLGLHDIPGLTKFALEHNLVE